MHMNDNNMATLPGSHLGVSGHGQAALLLVESLIHGLCEKATLRADEAVAIADRALDVQFARASEEGDAKSPEWDSHRLLGDIATSLRADVGEFG
jgi:hypothetical protein